MLNIVAAILCYDIWFYISHRLLHGRNFYHRIHHENQEPTFWDTYHGHWIESPFQSLGTVAPAYWFSYSFMDWLLIIFFLNVRGIMRHDNRFTWILGNHHILHHRYPGFNFGEKWLDRLCDTHYPNAEECVEGLIPFN